MREVMTIERKTAIRRSRLTDRDRQLIGFLAVARYLSTEQVARLVFPGRGRSVVSDRLRALAGDGRNAFQIPPVRRLIYSTSECGLSTAWALTPAGYAIAQPADDKPLPVPKEDIGLQFMDHAIALSDLFTFLAVPLVHERLQLAVAGLGSNARPQQRAKRLAGLYARYRNLPFRWTGEGDEGSRLPWKQYDPSKHATRERVIRPDAILELPSAKRRYFIECEMGTHPISPGAWDRPGSTIGKVERYCTFMNDLADYEGRTTFYAQTYQDNWPAQVLFLVQTASRERSVNAAIAEWKEERRREPIEARALTLHKAVAEIVALMGFAPADRSDGRSQGPKREGGDQASAPTFTPKELSAIKSFYGEVIRTTKEARARARAAGTPVPEYPASVQEVHEALQRVVSARAAR